MLYYTKYRNHNPEIIGKRKKVDSTIYSFDIETTSYIILDNIIYPALKYKDLSKDEQERCEYRSLMYIWTFGVNDIIYYGRTWEELKNFLDILEESVPYKKILFIHNLSFEFQFMKGVFNFTDVLARKSHKVMKCNFEDYNIEIRCTYMMSNCALKYLSKLFNLPVEKLVGELDYTKIRTPITHLTDNELKYSENDNLVIYYYILEELKTYERIDKIPLTSTGHVRRELKERIKDDYSYKTKVRKAINTEPHVYNLLQDAFAGGYTHANWIYTDEIIKDVDSYDFTSSYPYVLVTHMYPSTEFKKCFIKDKNRMSKKFAYILVLKMTNVKCKYYNNFISQSKCRKIVGGKYDNGRIISADSLEITVTDVDFNLIDEMYNFDYEILEAYYSKYNYLPIQFIDFVLEKYVNKTKFKNVPDKEIDYNKEKNKFNALYGMSVTNMIRDNVVFDNKLGWTETQLTNDEIIEALSLEKKKSFLSFAYGVWVTAYARSNLLKNVIKLDEYVIYCDTDSMKLKKGYNEQVIKDYNSFVERKIKYVSKVLDIDVNRFAPTDIYGVPHMLGLFEKENDKHEHTYDEFITQGAKKYAYKVDDEIHITVAGVPKNGRKALNSLEDFKDNFVFDFEHTNKNLIIYIENQLPVEITDYEGNKCIVNDISGCCLIPTTYVLGKSLEYSQLISDNSSKRARFRE